MVVKEVEKLESLYTVGGNVKWCRCYGNSRMVPQKIKNRTIIWSSNSTSEYTYPEELKAGSQTNSCTSVFVAVLFTIAKRWKQPTCPFDKWMDKQNVVYTHNGILLSIKKEGNSGTCYNMDELWGHNAKWNNPVTKR